MTCGAISEPLSLSVGSGSLGQPIQDLISPTVQSGRSKGGSQRTGARTRRVSWRLLRGRHGAAKDEAAEVTSLASLLCSGAGSRLSYGDGGRTSRSFWKTIAVIRRYVKKLLIFLK